MSSPTRTPALNADAAPLPPAVDIDADARALFASDMHLGEHDRATAEYFFDALAREAREVSHLFLLGDLFELWIGDDQRDEVVEQAIEAVRALPASVRVFVMRGNRDFLLDASAAGAEASAPPFSERLGAVMLDDPSIVTLFGQRCLLSHGDAWCIDDVDYQAFRRQSRSAEWQREFLSMPIEQRQAMARQVREQSEREKQDKSAYLMDVNGDEVRRVVTEQRVSAIIHGHTHRPACHALSVGDTEVRRWVLPDWDGPTRRGGFLRVDRDGWHRIGW